ncbi:MAG TPA: heparinase II/III family protein [Solirubrobacteraceae bacterium]|nr:heparinase II/III family protein [Solirubrobacteraceae bacterium]
MSDLLLRWRSASIELLVAALAELAALVGLVVLVGLTVAPATVRAAGAASLGTAHVGVPVAAPPPPAVGGTGTLTTSYSWERCAFYPTFVSADGAPYLWPLGDSGATAAESLNSNSGAYVGAHAVVADGPLAGQANPASSFDGRTSAVVLSKVPDEPGVVAYTIELWARPTTVDGSYRFLFSREATAAGKRQGTGIWVSRTGLGFERYSDGVGTSITYAPGLRTGVWSQVVATYDGSIMRLYVNGAQVGSRAASQSLASVPEPSVIGAGSAAHSGFFCGDLAEVGLYARAITRSHVAAHYAGAQSAPCTALAGAAGSSYTPVLGDLGNTLKVTVTAARANASASTSGSASTSASASTVAESSRPVDDGSGNVAQASIAGLSANQTVAGTVQVTAALAGLPADRIEFEVDGQYRYAKVAEAPYQYTWYTNAESNGPHTVTVLLWGPNAFVPVSTQVTVQVHNTTTAVTPLAAGRESMYAQWGEGDAASANNLLNDVWPARGYALPHLDWPLTWQEDPYHDAFWEFYFYGMQPLPTLLYEWKTTGNAAYLNKLVAILRSYAAYDATRAFNRTTFDNNHASAYRAMALVQFYFKLKSAGVLPADLDAGLVASLQKLGAFLAVPGHFEADYNHGFNEGAALLLIADNFPGWSQSAGWRQLAISRLQQMLTNTIDADGVEVENSPFYHVYVLGLVYQIAQWAKQYEPALAPSYSAAAQKMLAYAAEITQPSGYLPMLGATATTYMPSQDPNVYGPMAAADPGFDFAFTRGAHGTPPPDGAVLFPTAGLFVLRSPLGSTANLPNQTFVTFNAGTYRTDHSDLDALGMTMYSNGSTVLPTSGLFTYTQEPDREYFHGTRSNNTVVVDGGDQVEGSAQAGSYGSVAGAAGGAGAAGATGATGATGAAGGAGATGATGAAGGATWASGVSGLYAGVSHHRTVIVLRQGLTLVADALSSAASHAYAQTWHMAPGSTLSASGQTLTVTNAGKKTLAITQADPAGLTLQSFYGASDPMQGWYSNGYAFKQPDWALEYGRTGTSARYTTLLAAGVYAGQSATVADHAVSGGIQVDVCVGASTGYAVSVPSDNNVAPTITAGSCGA